MRKITSILITYLLILGSCADNVKENKVNTPSGVARIWLENYYYHNNYELAKSYSTVETATMIDTIKGMIFPDQENAEKLPFEIKNIKCKQPKGSPKAECTCTYVEAENSFTEELTLVQKDGQWLVDAIEEKDDMLKDEDIEKMTKDFEKTLDALLDQ